MITKDKALDLLKSVCTVGSGRIAKSLSDMLGVKAELSFPEVEFISLKGLLQKLNVGETFFIIETSLEGDVMGKLSFLLDLQDARILGSNLLKMSPAELDPQDPFFQSSLQETVNIFAGTFTGMLSEMSHLNIFYNVPFLTLGSKDSYLGSISRQFSDSDILFSMNMELKVKDIRFRGGLLFILDYNSTGKLFEALGQSEIFLWIENTKIKLGSKGRKVESIDVEYLKD
ncbi:MAG: hypothetical protein V1490_04135 [Candidatus Omnitrophota bacterium]